MSELDGWTVERCDRELAEPVDRRVDTSALMALREALVELERSHYLRKVAIDYEAQHRMAGLGLGWTEECLLSEAIAYARAASEAAP